MCDFLPRLSGVGVAAACDIPGGCVGGCGGFSSGGCNIDCDGGCDDGVRDGGCDDGVCDGGCDDGGDEGDANGDARAKGDVNEAENGEVVSDGDETDGNSAGDGDAGGGDDKNGDSGVASLLDGGDCLGELKGDSPGDNNEDGLSDNEVKVDFPLIDVQGSGEKLNTKSSGIVCREITQC